jgi:ribosome recycling factor
MSAAVEWYRKEVASLETRASGRVTPALLSPVRIELPGKGKELVKLEEVSTIGVRDGSTLIITVFEEHVSTLLWLCLRTFTYWCTSRL